MAWAGAVFRGEPAQIQAWLKPLVEQLNHEPTLKVIGRLEALLWPSPTGTTAQAAVARDRGCCHEQQERMGYPAGWRRGEPIGSGPVEATSRQSQCRLWQTGRFWISIGDKTLLRLDMLWCNGWWRPLLPFDPAQA